jgi:hypothetical protein
MTTPDDELLGELVPMLKSAEDGRWWMFRTDRPGEINGAVAFALKDDHSPFAGTPLHGRNAAIEWRTQTGDWTHKLGDAWIVQDHAIGHLRLRRPRARKTKEL